MDEQDTEIADDWMREHMPDPDHFSFEDAEGEGSTEKYFFLRLRDSASVVYKVAVKDGKVSSVLSEVYHGESSQDEPDEQQWLVKPEREEGSQADGARSRPSLHLEQVAGEAISTRRTYCL